MKIDTEKATFVANIMAALTMDDNSPEYHQHVGQLRETNVTLGQYEIPVSTDDELDSPYSYNPRQYDQYQRTYVFSIDQLLTSRLNQFPK